MTWEMDHYGTMYQEMVLKLCDFNFYTVGVGGGGDYLIPKIFIVTFGKSYHFSQI